MYKAQIGTSCGLSHINLGSKLYAANPWIVHVCADQIMAHHVAFAIGQENLPIHKRVGNKVPRKSCVEEMKSFL